MALAIRDIGFVLENTSDPEIGFVLEVDGVGDPADFREIDG